MKLRRYDLGELGRLHLLDVLKAGRALSLALADFVDRITGDAFTVLPTGMDSKDVFNFAAHLKQYEYPTGRGAHADRILSDYDPVESLLIPLVEEAASRPSAMLWAEDFLARKGDPAHLEGFAQTCYLDDTVTYLVRSNAIASARNREVVHQLRTIPHWAATIIDAGKVGVLPHGSIGDHAVINMLETATLIVVQSYETDGFVFFKPDR